MTNINSPIRVLCVDDSSEIHALIRLGLRDSRFDIVGVSFNGSDALDLLGSLEVDIVLLDIFMPIITGVEALPLVRAKCPHAAIFMLTSVSERSVVLECRDKGANGFIIKNSESLLHLSDRVSVLYKRYLRKDSTVTDVAPIHSSEQ